MRNAKYHYLRDMQLNEVVQAVFQQLTQALQQLTIEQYARTLPVLSGASVGKHVRHIIDMFLCLERGYRQGVINYEHRDRDLEVELDPQIAIAHLSQILQDIRKADKSLLLEGSYHAEEEGLMQFQTHYHREIVYNLEHTIHHMALIKIGLQAVSTVPVSPHFGVAPSTVKHQQACAQ